MGLEAQLINGSNLSQKTENSLLVQNLVNQQKNQSNVVYLKDLFQDLFFLFCLLMICTRQLNLVPYITLLMIQIYSSLKKINKHINRDLKLIVDWIRANKLSLKASKSNIVLFKFRNKKITKQLNFRVSGQKIKQSSQVRYLGIILQDYLHQDAHLTDLEKKLSRSIGLL